MKRAAAGAMVLQWGRYAVAMVVIPSRAATTPPNSDGSWRQWAGRLPHEKQYRGSGTEGSLPPQGNGSGFNWAKWWAHSSEATTKKDVRHDGAAAERRQDCFHGRERENKRLLPFTPKFYQMRRGLPPLWKISFLETSFLLQQQKNHHKAWISNLMGPLLIGPSLNNKMGLGWAINLNWVIKFKHTDTSWNFFGIL